MPIGGVDHVCSRTAGPSDLLVDDGHDRLTIAYVQVAVRIGEIILDIDDNKRRLQVISNSHTADPTEPWAASPRFHGPRTLGSQYRASGWALGICGVCG